MPPGSNPILWLALLALFAALSWIHGRQALLLKRALQRPMPPNAKAVMQQSLYSSVAVIAVAAVGAVGLMVYDWRLGKMTQANDEMMQALSALQTQRDELSATLDAQTKETVRLSGLIPSNVTVESQAQLDAIKRRYEEIFVTHLLLKRCNQTRPEDYHILNSALMRDLASLNTQSRLQYDIITAAKGTVDGLYANPDCASADITKLLPNYQRYITSLRDQYTMP